MSRINMSQDLTIFGENYTSKEEDIFLGEMDELNWKHCTNSIDVAVYREDEGSYDWTLMTRRVMYEDRYGYARIKNAGFSRTKEEAIEARGDRYCEFRYEGELDLDGMPDEVILILTLGAGDDAGDHQDSNVGMPSIQQDFPAGSITSTNWNQVGFSMNSFVSSMNRVAKDLDVIFLKWLR